MVFGGVLLIFVWAFTRDNDTNGSNDSVKGCLLCDCHNETTTRQMTRNAEKGMVVFFSSICCIQRWPVQLQGTEREKGVMIVVKSVVVTYVYFLLGRKL